ncbi:unnamed protein product [Ambrosiozyma monospora]|uniref:Large ribosomal subunit protein mL40 n=1 Tax=Ambrosiozyma monospora TaxID=43982 RepID=A0A9W6Z2L3_AMBMO|nr:unnamed protein product [Ambrosiozyma monospora]
MFSHQQIRKPLLATFQQIRSKRTTAISPEVQKLVTQLSVLSAGRKQPRLLKLCNEDYVKHQIITKAWSQLRNQKKKSDEALLNKQLDSMSFACEELKKISPELYNLANKKEYGKRFPLEIRVPTEYPPRNIWYYDYVPPVAKDSKK